MLLLLLLLLWSSSNHSMTGCATVWCSFFSHSLNMRHDFNIVLGVNYFEHHWKQYATPYGADGDNCNAYRWPEHRIQLLNFLLVLVPQSVCHSFTGTAALLVQLFWLQTQNFIECSFNVLKCFRYGNMQSLILKASHLLFMLNEKRRQTNKKTHIKRPNELLDFFPDGCIITSVVSSGLVFRIFGVIWCLSFLSQFSLHIDHSSRWFSLLQHEIYIYPSSISARK